MQYTANGFENILNEFRGALERGEELLPNSARQHGKTYSFQTIKPVKKEKPVSEPTKETEVNGGDTLVVKEEQQVENKPKKKTKKKDSK